MNINAQVLTSTKCTNINRIYCIETDLTLYQYQHQNYEGIGRNFKHEVHKLSHNTPHAQHSYWYYVATFLDKNCRYLSDSAIRGRYRHDVIEVETGDKSIYRFYWFETIRLYNTHSSLPKYKMEPGLFLYLTDNTRDGVSYEIIPVKHWFTIPLHQ